MKELQAREQEIARQAERESPEEIQLCDAEMQQFVKGFDALGHEVMSLPRFPGHLDCGEFVAQRGVQDGYPIPTRVPSARGRVGAAPLCSRRTGPALANRHHGAPDARG